MSRKDVAGANSGIRSRLFQSEKARGMCSPDYPGKPFFHHSNSLALSRAITLAIASHALIAGAFKGRISGLRQMPASSANIASLQATPAHHRLEIAAFNAIGTPHDQHSRVGHRSVYAPRGC
jgi:hypothetical protein